MSKDVGQEAAGLKGTKDWRHLGLYCLCQVCQYFLLRKSGFYFQLILIFHLK